VTCGKSKGPPVDAGSPLELIASAWAPELAKEQESELPPESFPVLLPEEELCRGPEAFP